MGTRAGGYAVDMSTENNPEVANRNRVQVDPDGRVVPPEGEPERKPSEKDWSEVAEEVREAAEGD
ncbi:hypothetical protein [Amycolatopsis sp. CA-230715]|uniref:hypothetical protein n=1 Tax=Amycolatopsis sp. CA-230715 TaxID=2745196 RepID=UPI001C0382BB|nr:hypothetical protein [Amycolatopsis sp. CA-230715]QWF84745.1 hypothetical protein HUW46_08197 [Amycolatopsis sp. CA-230715]